MNLGVFEERDSGKNSQEACLHLSQRPATKEAFSGRRNAVSNI